ncbi:MAG: TetR/AcrR family transcriptional regulator [Desulfobacterales bacterium]|nr:TetR/AcrR family transcriptional regulator [Desulfobacterales bacterium]
MGRKSIAPQRQKEILDAFERCINKYGFNNASTRRIAEEAEINQPMIAHYFGNKEALVDALAHRFMNDYVSRMNKKLGNSTGKRRIQKLLDFLFGSGLKVSKEKRKILVELLAASVHDSKLGLKIKAMYRSFGEVGRHELQKAFPDISAEKREKCVYGILCLAVGNDSVLSTALPDKNRKYALKCAESLISELTP